MKNSETGPIETQGRGACSMGRGAQKKYTNNPSQMNEGAEIRKKGGALCKS